MSENGFFTDSRALLLALGTIVNSEVMALLK
jgi:hypothetical protein